MPEQCPSKLEVGDETQLRCHEVGQEEHPEWPHGNSLVSVCFHTGECPSTEFPGRLRARAGKGQRDLCRLNQRSHRLLRFWGYSPQSPSRRGGRKVSDISARNRLPCHPLRVHSAHSCDGGRIDCASRTHPSTSHQRGGGRTR